MIAILTDLKFCLNAVKKDFSSFFFSKTTFFKNKAQIARRLGDAPADLQRLKSTHA